MKIIITDIKKISTVQNQFSAEFPNLKLEFFTKIHSKGEASKFQDLIKQDRTLGEFRMRKDIEQVDRIEINSEMTVAELEQCFLDGFGISVQVFRKSGNAWLETTATDSWTLGKQEQEARFLAEKISDQD